MPMGVAVLNRSQRLLGQNPMLSIRQGIPGAVFHMDKNKNKIKIFITGVHIPGEPHGVGIDRR